MTAEVVFNCLLLGAARDDIVIEFTPPEIEQGRIHGAMKLLFRRHSCRYGLGWAILSHPIGDHASSYTKIT